MTPGTVPVLPLTQVAAVLRMLYGAAAAANDFVDRHIRELEASALPMVQATGRVLRAAKSGFAIGYMASTAIVAVGQLLLGHPLLAGLTVVSSTVLLNPVAVSCGAVGAIVYGWGALRDQERTAILERTSEILDLTLEMVRGVIGFVLEQMRTIARTDAYREIKSFVKQQAEEFGKTLGEVTGNVKDRARDLLASKPKPQLLALGDAPLQEVIAHMQSRELESVLDYAFGVKEPDLQGLPALQQRLASEFAAAGSYSLPLVKGATYAEVLVMVARSFEIPVPLNARAADIERAILFRVMQRSLDKMDDRTRQEFVQGVQADLAGRGVRGRVTFDELARFVKFAGLDVGGSIGTLVMTAPGLAGVAGLNIAQLAVLKGIIFTSGYIGAVPAVLGMGTGGALMLAAGAAGPIALGLGLVYTGYRLSGPAYRKLIPAVCAVAAKRIEMAAAGDTT